MAQISAKTFIMLLSETPKKLSHIQGREDEGAGTYQIN